MSKLGNTPNVWKPTSWATTWQHPIGKMSLKSRKTLGKVDARCKISIWLLILHKEDFFPSYYTQVDTLLYWYGHLHHVITWVHAIFSIFCLHMAPEQYLSYLIWLVVKSFHSRARFVHTYAGIYKNITANTYLHTRQNFEW